MITGYEFLKFKKLFVPMIFNRASLKIKNPICSYDIQSSNFKVQKSY